MLRGRRLVSYVSFYENKVASQFYIKVNYRTAERLVVHFTLD